MPKKIAIEGGACSGKTTGLVFLAEGLWERGIRPLIAPEMATQFIAGGLPDINTIAQENSALYCEIERQIFLSQDYYEKRLEVLAREFEQRGERTVILCDRGKVGVRAFVGQDDYENIVRSAGYDNEHQVREGYDAVVHLVTAAKGAEAYYTTANNQARRETLEEARIADDRTMDAWKDHSHLVVIDNIHSRDFKHKIQRTLQAVLEILGIPEPVERERKFLLVYPSIEVIAIVPELEGTRTSTIEQIYLTSPTDERVRIRKRTFDEFSLYYETRKRFVRPGENVEVERRITAEEYQMLCAQQKLNTRVIKKMRRCFVYKDRRFELDTFSNPLGICLLEVELADLDEQVELPPFLRIIKEVTDDPRYSNYNLARLS